jgi:DNA-binding NtrC family response regulator
VLICDDRADVGRELASTLRLGSSDSVHGVSDAAALLDAYRETATDLVLIGVHSGSTVGSEALGQLLERHPAAAPIVFGSITDIDLLAAAFARGVGGLLLWEPGKRPPNPVA